MKRNLNYVKNLCVNRSFFENDFVSDITNSFIPEKKDEMMQEIEKEILEWLKDENGETVFTQTFKFVGPESQIKATDRGCCVSILFSRSDIFIKSCSNEWEVWRIATASNYPKMISYKVCNIGLNDYNPDKDEPFPNEIRCDNYESERKE